MINDHINRNVLILISFIQNESPPSTTYIPQLRKFAFLTTTTSNYTAPNEEIDPLSFSLPPLFSYSKKEREIYVQQKGKSSSPCSLIHRRIIPDFPFPSSDEETVSLFRTITFRLNRPLSSGLITFTGLSIFSRDPGSVAFAFPAALLLLLLGGELLLLLASTDVVSLLETGDGLAALLLLLVPEVSSVLPAEIVRWRITGAGKLSFLSIASTVR